LFDKKKIKEVNDGQRKWEETALSKYVQKTPERKKEFVEGTDEEIARRLVQIVKR